MLNMLNMSVGEYLRENIVLTVALAIILALIAALSGVMIYLQVKAKRSEKPRDEADETKVGEEAPEAETKEETDEEKAEGEEKETPAEEGKQEPAAPAEEKKEEKETAGEQKDAAPEEKKEAEKPKQEPKKEPEKPVGFRDGKWIIRKTPEGKFSFKLYASNGGIMIDSNKEYASLSSAKNGIETYKKNLEENNCKIVSTKAGHFVYRLSNANGMLLAVSSNYTSKSSCENALELTRRYALSAPLEILTD